MTFRHHRLIPACWVSVALAAVMRNCATSSLTWVQHLVALIAAPQPWPWFRANLAWRQHSAVDAAHSHRRDWRARGALNKDHSLSFRVRSMAIAPVRHREQHRL